MSSHPKWAVVTGASSGLGADFARQLAARGYHLLITARRLDRLQALADEIRGAARVEVECASLDLGAPGAAEELYERAVRGGRHIHVLVNNAGFGTYDSFEHQDLSRLQELLRLNVFALTELAWRFVRHMRDHGEPSYLLNVGSIAAWQPVPWFAVYAASKSYVRDFSEAIAVELADTNVGVTCLSPGGTWTEFSDVAGQKLGPLARTSMLGSAAVVREGLDALFARRPQVVTGWLNKINCFLTRFSPRRLTARLAGRILGGRPVRQLAATREP